MRLITSVIVSRIGLFPTQLLLRRRMRPLRPTFDLARASHRCARVSSIRRTALIARTIHSSPISRNIPQWPNPPVPQPQVTPLDSSDPHHEGHRRSRSDKSSFWKQWANSASFQAALTTVVGLGMVFGAGVGYLEWYKAHVLHRVGFWSRSSSISELTYR